MNIQNDRALGPEDFATVILGKGREPSDEFRDHPRVQWLDLNRCDPSTAWQQIGDHTKILILTDGITSGVNNRLVSEAKDRRIVYIHRKGGRAVAAALRDMFPADVKPAPVTADGNGYHAGGERGKIKRFLADHKPDLSKGSTEEARRLMVIAKSVGLVTTVASLSQAIHILKRAAGAGEIPASARPKNPKADALQVLDDAIAGLQLMREWIEAVTTEVTELRASQLAISKALGMAPR